MKRLFTALTLCLFSYFVQAQKIDISEIEDSFTTVKESSIAVSQKFINAKAWIATTFGDYNSVIQLEDKDNYKIIIKGISKLPEEDTEDPIFELPLHIIPSLHYTMTLDFKDDRYRFRLESINCHSIWQTKVLGEIVHSEQNQNIKQFCTPVNRPQIELNTKVSELERLQNADVESMSKREVRQHLDKIQEIKSQIEVLSGRAAKVGNIYKKREESIEITIISMIESLHTAINTKDDF